MPQASDLRRFGHLDSGFRNYCAARGCRKAVPDALRAGRTLRQSGPTVGDPVKLQGPRCLNDLVAHHHLQGDCCRAHIEPQTHRLRGTTRRPTQWKPGRRPHRALRPNERQEGVDRQSRAAHCGLGMQSHRHLRSPTRSDALAACRNFLASRPWTDHRAEQRPLGRYRRPFVIALTSMLVAAAGPGYKR